MTQVFNGDIILGMDLIKSATRRNALGELIYGVLNAAYALLLLVLIISFDTPYLAFVVVLLSKWRVFAVRPRFWMANIQTNMLDTVMGLSVATALWQNAGNLWVQLAITVSFAAWLIWLKPSSKKFWIVMQGGITQFIALSALLMIGHMLPAFIVVALGGLIGYVVARHIINVYNSEHEDVVISVAWALVIAELSWLATYWTVAYTPLKITQIALVATLLGYMTLVVYNHLHQREQGSNVRRDLVMPIVFSLIGVGLLLVIFNFFDPTSL